MEQGLRESNLTVVQERAILVACLLPRIQVDPHDPLKELRSLAQTAGAVVVDEMMQNRHKPDVATFLGKGKVEELANLVKAHKADVVIFENDLSPSQISNIEEVVLCKVLDRSELILDIFAGRAKTTEAKLQVELAQLEYTYPRLRAMWSHLERIVGGAPTGIGTRGPGEQQLEIDRRIVQRKISQLKEQIREVQARKEREVSARNKDFITVGLVGYTNAGKSTLFNTLTTASGGGGAYADNKLFATLSTRTRKWPLGEGDMVMLSDTVGFIRDLPHHLVASFRATLEEAVHSELLVIVLDVAHPQHREQLQTVLNVLDQIGANSQPRLLALNKADLLENNADLLVLEKEFPGPTVTISALTGRGLGELTQQVRELSRGDLKEINLLLNMQTQGKIISYLETRAEVLERHYQDHQATFRVRLGRRQLEQIRAMGLRLPQN